MARLQSLDLDKKIGLDGVTAAKAEEALELTDFVLVIIFNSFFLFKLNILNQFRSF